MKDTKTTRYAYAHSGIVPVRKEATDTSEMVTQLVLGETMLILESLERWHRVRCDFDGYEGWVSVAQVVFFADELQYAGWVDNEQRKRSPFFSYRISRGKTQLMVPPGSPIVFSGYEVELPDGRWDVVGRPEQLKEHAIIDSAMKLLGTPYLWGGRTDAGIDCSGFIQLVYGLHRYNLPRDAWQQHAFAPCKSADIKEADYGDIVYFGPSPDKIVHVGFYIGEGKLLHAGGNVMIQSIDVSRGGGSRYEYNEKLARSVVGIQQAAVLKVAGTPPSTRKPLL
jgi:hypothetical protein